MDRLAKKIERVTHFLHQNDPDLIILTEHGLTQTKLQLTRVVNYSLVGGFCRKNHLKGGVAAYVKEELSEKIKLISTTGEASELKCEAALYEIRTGKENLLVLGVYRPPDSNINDVIDILTEMLDKTLEKDKKLLIMGDINVDDKRDKNESTKINDLLASYNIKRMSLPPTRITPTSKSSIDWVCSNFENNLKVQVTLTGLSDHTAQTVTINISKQASVLQKEKTRIFSNDNLNNLKSTLKQQNWETVLNTDNTNIAYENFNEIIQLSLNSTCPYTFKRAKRKRKNVNWDKETETLKKEYIKALEKYLFTGLERDKKETALRKKAYDIKLKTLKQQQVTKLIENSDNKSKALWRVINEERRSQTNHTSQLTLDIEGKTTDDPIKIANHLNHFFANIAEETLKQNTQGPVTQTQQNHIENKQMIFTAATENEVLSIIKSMKSKTSSGLDEISSKLVKKCKEELSVPLTHIINCSLQEGTFPEKLKISKVYPKYKSGPTTEASSYRPISLTSAFSKIIEKVVLDRLINYLNQNNLLTDNQHGFLKGRSTVTAITQLIEHVIDQIETGKTVTSLFLDFSKAFDCLDHDLLLKKLQNLGINGISGNWFQSYLTGRKQLVELKHNQNGTISKARSLPLQMNRGVPQGSVLGPVLFLLLTNDLPGFMDSLCQTVMYADDTVLTLANKNKEQLREETNTSFDLVKQYCSSNDLVLNENKTVQITYSTRGNEPDGLPNVKVEASTNYLGITLDMNLKWNNHIEVLCKKLASGIYVIRRIKQICGTPAAKIAYFSLFEAHVRYGILAWGGTTNLNMERILLHQKKAIRILANLEYRDSCRQAFQEHKILTVPSLYISEVILLAISTNKTKLGDYHQYSTRNASNFSLPIHHLSLTEKKPTYKGALYFNNLPDHLKQDTGRPFKKKLLKWLEDHPFYTEKEFMEWRS